MIKFWVEMSLRPYLPFSICTFAPCWILILIMVTMMMRRIYMWARQGWAGVIQLKDDYNEDDLDQDDDDR